MSECAYRLQFVSVTCHDQKVGVHDEISYKLLILMRSWQLGKWFHDFESIKVESMWNCNWIQQCMLCLKSILGGIVYREFDWLNSDPINSMNPSTWNGKKSSKKKEINHLINQFQVHGAIKWTIQPKYK